MHRNSKIQTNSSLVFDKWAFALKTGKDVALKRTPIQMLTFLADIRNIILIGEAPDVFVANVPMVDVVSNQKSNYDDGYSVAPEMRHDSAAGHSLKKRHVDDEYNPRHPKRDQERPETYTRLFKRSSDQIVPDEGSMGWKSDAKKNIPGIKVLYDRYPNADWYFMIDDDTYVFMDNMKDNLDKFNPNDPVYMGAATNFIGCDDIHEWGKSIYFAHGGSGIVMSRAAVLKILPIIEKCATKYDSCWAGDIRLGLCFRDAGVLVQNAGYFSPDAPNNRFNFSFPCATPRTFHHLLPHQIQKLYQLEQVSRSQGRKLLLADVFQAFLDNRAYLNYDRPGGDFKNVPSGSADDCKDQCSKNSKCVSYLFENMICYMKKTAPPMKKRLSGAVTGLIIEHFSCNKLI